MVTLLYLTRLRTLCWRTKKAVLDYRYGHSALFDQTEDFVLGMKKAVLDYRYGHSALFDQTEDFVLAHEEGSAGLQVWSLCSI